MAPFVRYCNMNVDSFSDSGETSGTINTLGIGVIFGSQHFYWKMFSLDFFLGISDYFKLSNNRMINNESGNPQFTGLELRTGITIGLAFK
jgi:hypothetical protein